MAISVSNVSKTGYYNSGTVRPEGRVIFGSSTVEPDAIVVAGDVSAGDVLTYNPFNCLRDFDSDVGVAYLDENAVPLIEGNGGSYELTYKINGGSDLTATVASTTEKYILETYFYARPELDADGWSVLTPSPTANIYYVSASGNDATAGPNGDGTGAYTLSTLPTPDDWENPGAVNAYATIGVANSLMAAGDWLLINRGDTFERSTRLDAPDVVGSTTYPTVYGAYGTGARPIIDCQQDGIRLTNRNMVLRSIEFYSSYRDPDHVNFVGVGNEGVYDGIDIRPVSCNAGEYWLVEDCEISQFALGVGLADISSSASNNVILRRNIIHHNWCSTAHAQGVYSSGSRTLFEGNVLYHNGWRESSGVGAGATVYNHNLYVTKTKNSILRDNISISPSSINFKFTSNYALDEYSTYGAGSVEFKEAADAAAAANGANSKNVVVKNNVFIGGGVGISAGGNQDSGIGYQRFENFDVVDNVFYRTGYEATAQTIAWGCEFLSHKNSAFCGNIFSKLGILDGSTSTRALSLLGDCKDVYVSSNVFYDVGEASESYSNNGCLISTGTYYSIYRDETIQNYVDGLEIHNNYLQNINTENRLISGSVGYNVASQTSTNLSGNKYYSPVADQSWFGIAGVESDLTAFIADTGETGYSSTEYSFSEIRTIETYQTALGETATVEAFRDNCLAQRKGSWDTDLEASRVVRYFKEGYK